jgi:hypothetical protein
MKKITIFLASSAELKDQREQLEREIYRKCKAWFEKGIFLHLEIWEDLSAKISPTRSQDEYNKLIKKEADLFVLLAHTKVGIYTDEEFEQAYGVFKAENKPYIFTYFMVPTAPVEPSLEAFRKKVNDLGHFEAIYTNGDDLWVKFNKELDRLEQAGFEKNEFVKTTVNITSRTITQGKKSVYVENGNGITINIQ